MKFSIYKLDGTLVEFRAVWYHRQHIPEICFNLELPITHRLVKRTVGFTVCTLTPIVAKQINLPPLAQGDAACSASEPNGYSKQRGRVASFGSALKAAGFKRVERAALWEQYWKQQGHHNRFGSYTMLH